jgi:hypothetical protein
MFRLISKLTFPEKTENSVPFQRDEGKSADATPCCNSQAQPTKSV